MKHSFSFRRRAALRLEALDARIVPATVYAATKTNQLLAFDSANPGTVLSARPISGLQANETLLALDVRPGNGQLYGLGSANRLYTVNPATGAATQVGTGTFASPLSGSDFGMDFDPVTDRLRVVTDLGLNLRLDPNTGAIVDGNPSMPGTQFDSLHTPTTFVIAAAYTPAAGGATTLYGLDWGNDQLVRLGGPAGSPSPNLGQVTWVGDLTVNTTSLAGFDITADGTAYAFMTVGGSAGLYTVNLATGAATLVGTLGDGTAPIRGMAVVSTAPAPPPPASFRFGATSYIVGESAATATITLQRNGDLSAATTVTVTASSGTATAGSDFTAVNQPLTFAVGEANKTITVTIINDTVVEGNETVNLALSSPTGGATLGTPASAVLTIQDDDVTPPSAPAQFQFGGATFSAGEAAGTATVTVQRTGNINVATTVTVAATAGTATAGSDFTPVTQALSFAAGETSKTLSVAILNDTAVEGNETITLALSGPTNGAVLGTPAGAVLTIVDDDQTTPPPPPPPPPGLTPVIYAVGTGAGAAPQVKVYNADGSLRFSFLAYEASFTGGVRVATGDVTGDGTPDIITGTGNGGGPLVKVFSGTDGALVRSFFAYESSFRGGVLVAAGDVTGDGRPDIVTGTGVGGGPLVKVWDGVSGAQERAFFAYESTFRGGVNVAAGDVNGDGQADVITGAGVGGGPLVKAFSGTDGTILQSFFAYDSALRGGVNVTAGHYDADGKADIVAGAGVGGGPHVKVFSGLTAAQLASFFAYDPAFRGGVRVGMADLNGDGRADVLTAPGNGGGPHVKAFNAAAAGTLADFFPLDPGFRGGVFVG